MTTTTTTIDDYRTFLTKLNTLDVSLNIYIKCVEQNAETMLQDPIVGNYYVSNPNLSCSIVGGTINLGTLSDQVIEGSNDLQTLITNINNDITNSKYSTSTNNVNIINEKYKSVLEKRQRLDNKMRELYANSRSENDMQIQTDSAVYGALLWTVLATSLLYYVFVKL